MTSRARAKGRRGGEAEPFARIPISVLESEAVRTLDHAAFKILVIIAADCWWHPVKLKGRNGTAAFTEVFQEKWGFKGRDTLYRALRELTERGLLVRTRDGQRIRNRFALYGLGWLPITHRDGQLLDRPEPSPNLWKQWKQPAASIPMAGSVPAQFVTDGRECSTPTIGSGQPEYVPTIGNTEPVSRPMVGHTSLRLGERAQRQTQRSTRASPQGSLARGAADLARRVVKLAALQPHLSPADIARTFNAPGVDSVAVAQILESHAESNR